MKGYRRALFGAILIVLPACIKKEEVINGEPRICSTKTASRDALIKSADFSVSQIVQEDTFSLPLVTKPLSQKDEAERCEALLVDVPIPVIAKVESASCDGHGVIKFTYNSTLSHKELFDFYNREMERSGWQQETSFVGNEILLCFKKPSKSCIVSMRPTKNTWEKSKHIKVSLFLEN